MCGRLNIQATQLTKLLMAILQEEYPGADNPNAAPTETLPVLRAGSDGEIECVLMRWWLTPSWSEGPSTRYSMFNAKAKPRPKVRLFAVLLRPSVASFPYQVFTNGSGVQDIGSRF